MINEAAASNHVAMVVLKNFLLAANQWMREKLLHWRNLTSIEQTFLQCIYFVALSFSLYRKHYDGGLKLQKTSSCSCWRAMHPLKASLGVSPTQSVATVGIHCNRACQLQTSEKPRTLSWTPLMLTRLCVIYWHFWLHSTLFWCTVKLEITYTK